nr:transmembrane protein 120 homolog isoform X3 [Elaeis guineensis]
MMQGVAMLLQNRYQRQRLYTRIALGKAKRMDVVWGETSGVEGQLLLLCPILFILQTVSFQGFEAYVGILLLRTALVGVIRQWQVVVCGSLLVLMAVGSFANTVQTLMAKSRFKAKMRRTESRHDFDSNASPPDSSPNYSRSMKES